MNGTVVSLRDRVDGIGSDQGDVYGPVNCTLKARGRPVGSSGNDSRVRAFARQDYVQLLSGAHLFLAINYDASSTLIPLIPGKIYEY